MFGYVNINKPELKMKDFYKYKAYYCGLCNTLKKKYGRLGQLTLTYDMTFLILLLTSLYESNTIKEQHRCVVHSMKKQDMLSNEITEYVADMNIALTYHHLKDDRYDEKSIVGLAGTGILKSDYKKIYKKYPRQCRVIEECLNSLIECEKNNEKNIDKVSRCFGELMAEIFVYRQDQWEEILRKTGFFLGKFIYIMDAYDDLEKDRKNNSYNPLMLYYNKGNTKAKDNNPEADKNNTEADKNSLEVNQSNLEADKINKKINKNDFETECRNMLTMMIAECTAEFEKLPCITDADILRNILYEGIWTKYDSIQKEKYEKEKEGIKHDSRSI
jgi:hypothetical protein